jgi:4-carboxymuconolactone decarboxylase
MPRLPALRERDLLPEDKREIFDYLVKTRGAVSNGFGVILNSPEMGGRIAHLGSYMRFESSLTPRMTEIAALTASAELGNSYERTIHAGGAKELGVSAGGIEAITAGGNIDSVDAEDRLAVRCAREMIRDHALSDAAFNDAHAALGDRGVVDLIGTIAYYGMLAYIHTSLEVLPPPAS